MLWHKLQGAGGIGGVPIEYVGGYVEGFAGTTSNKVITFGGNLTGGLASSASTDDLVIVYFATASTSSTNRDLVISGYTEIFDLFSSAGSSRSVNLAVGRKFMGATPDTTVTLTGGTINSSDPGTIAIQVFRYIDKTTPLDVTSTETTLGTGSAVNPPAITPVTKGAWIVAGGALGHSEGVDTFSSSDLTNFISVGYNTTGADVTVGMGYYPSWTSGSFDPATFTFSGGNSSGYSRVAATLALRPATP